MPNAPNSCDLTRRDLLQVGSIGTLGLSLPSMLIAESAASKETGSQRGEKSCIFILQYGGAPQQDMWDLKPNAPEEIRGSF